MRHIVSGLHRIATPGEVVEELLLQAVEVLLCVQVLMLVRDGDVKPVLWLEQVSVLMLWQFILQLHTCHALRTLSNGNLPCATLRQL